MKKPNLAAAAFALITGCATTPLPETPSPTHMCFLKDFDQGTDNSDTGHGELVRLGEYECHDPAGLPKETRDMFHRESSETVEGFPSALFYTSEQKPNAPCIEISADINNPAQEPRAWLVEHICMRGHE